MREVTYTTIKDSVTCCIVLLCGVVNADFEIVEAIKQLYILSRQASRVTMHNVVPRLPPQNSPPPTLR
jgi:hypothetical protein